MLEGEHVFRVGDEEFRVGPGRLVFGPRGVPHAQRRVVPRAGRVLTMMLARPASRASSASWPRPRATARIGPAVYASVSRRYGVTWLDG